MKNFNGWAVLVLAGGMAYLLWRYQVKSMTGKVDSLPNTSETNFSLGAPAFNQPASGATSVGEEPASTYDTGEDSGAGPQSRAQTEAAYNASATVGSGTVVATGIGAQSDDYDQFADPSDLY